MIGLPGVEAEVRAVLLLAGVGVLAYYLFINGVYLVIHLAAIHRLRNELERPDVETTNRSLGSPFLPGVAILVPAFNEEAVIVETVQALLNLNYPATEIIVINDGSQDRTLDRLHSEFDLQLVDAEPPFDIDTRAIRNVFKSARTDDLLVIDRENGGKSEALNTGLWLTDQPLFCAIDADSLIDPDGLTKVLRPFIDRPEETVAVGGTVQVANGCDIEDGRVSRIGLPDSFLGRIQVMEYLRAFYSGRLGLAQIGSLILISGAFGVFRTDLIREIGGYNTESITE
ncbi:MAG: glycosyltransferase family 2 protein, partial [Halobacteriales archaeon]|nr:glycosyltransferase family 2 protein [Halobacteriales archaeon]